MAEIIAAKNAQLDRQLEEQKSQVVPQSVKPEDDRKARLLAQRDLLRKQKQEKMQQELQEFKAKTTNKNNLFDELKKIDNELKEREKKGIQSDEDDEAIDISHKRIQAANANLPREEEEKKADEDDLFGNIKAYKVWIPSIILKD